MVNINKNDKNPETIDSTMFEKKQPKNKKTKRGAARVTALVGLSLLSVLIMTTAGVACNDILGSGGLSSSSSSESFSGDSSSMQETNVEITLNKTEASIHLFETVSLTARVKGASSAVTWSSSNENVATVSQQGLVMPVSVGTVTITATVEDTEVSCAVTINPHQGDIEIIVPYDTLEVKMGSTKNISAMGCLGLINDVSGGVFTYKVDDPSVVRVADDGTVTPLKVGETTIEIKGSFKGVTATGITIPVKVETLEKETLLEDIQFYANRQNNISIDLSKYNFDKIDTFEMDGVAYNYTLSGKTLNVSKEQFAKLDGGKKSIVISGTTATGDIVIDGVVDYVNYAIGTAQEFIDFQTIYATKRGTEEDRKGIYTYVLLTDNLDLSGADLNYGRYACNFYGVFDGQGYTIDDVVVNTNSIFYQIGDKRFSETTIFKNVAFTNCLKKTGNAGGVLACNLENVLMENVYLQGNQLGNGADSGNNPGYTGAFADCAQGGGNAAVTIRNCFVQIESEAVKPMAGALIARAQEGIVTIENCYAISATAKGLYGQFVGTDDQGYDSVVKKAVSTNLYTSINGFKQNVKTVPLGYDIDIWEIKNGLLTFKSIEQSWEMVEIEGEQLAAANRADQLEFDFNTYSVQNAKVLSVLVGRTPVPYAFADNKLTISSSDLTARGNVDVSVTLKTATGKLTADAQVRLIDYAIGNAQEFADFQLVYASQRGQSGDRTGKYTYVLLTDNIDLSTTEGPFEYWTIACNFYGYFDGQGYTVSNFSVDNSLLYKVGDARYNQITIFKNVGFVNCTRDAGTAGGVLANILENAIIENVYIQGNQLGEGSGNTPGYTGAFADYAQNNGTEKTVTIRNCLVQMESEGVKKMAGALVARVQEGYTTIENCYAISSTAVGLYGQFTGMTDQGYDAITSKACTTNFYTSMDAFKETVTSVPTGFNTKYWRMSDGMLVFKSAYIREINIEGESLVAINRNQALEIDLTAYDVESVDRVTVGDEKISSYTYANKTLTIASSDLAKGHVSITLRAQTSTDEAIIEAQAYVVDYAIGSVEELNNFRDGYAGYNNTMPYLYVVLTDNIDYENGEYYGEATATGTFFGSFDGQGHTISNIKVKNSFFVAIHGIANGKRSVIKNFGLENIIKHTANGGGLLANDMLDTDVDNVYVSGMVEQYQVSIIDGQNMYICGAIAGTAYRTTVTNSVAKIEYANASETLPSLIGIVGDEVYVENIYALLLNSTAHSYNWSGHLNITKHNMTYSVEAFKNATNSLVSAPTGFNQEYWSITENGIMFNSAV